MSSKRSIFEEVSEDDAPRAATQPGAIDRGRKGARGGIRVWLMILFALVVLMISVGGLTRLTDSGLSITEWRPITGALPPLNAAEWAAEFEKYKAIDEFQLQNQWMEMSDFKVIYWWEWGHRQLGRFIGLVWAVGFLGFLVTRSIPTGWTGRLLIPGLLGGVQGAVGWWMVSSGVTQGEGMTDVASYRLATHLGLAFVILGVLAWFTFAMGREERDMMQARRSRDARGYGLATGLLHLTFLQILLGALVAGIDAGRSYTDWPLMSGEVFPSNALDFQPIWRNFFENAGMVQFMHRVTGYLVLLFGIFVWVRSRSSANTASRFAFNAAFAALLLQIVLGIVTVLYAAPWYLAIAHQLLAVALFVLILRARFLSAYPVSQSIRAT
ncbi:MAG: heme A synthase [Pseudomonadota bacterium]